MSIVEAYMATYPNASRETAYRGGSALMRIYEVAAAIEKRLNSKGLSADRALADLAELAEANLEHFVVTDEKGYPVIDLNQQSAKDHWRMLKRIKVKRSRRITGHGDDAEEWEDENVEIELKDDLSALEKIGRFHKLFGEMPVTGTLSLDVTDFEKALDMVYGPKDGVKNGNGTGHNGHTNGKSTPKQG